MNSAIKNLTEAELKAIRINLQMRDASDDQTREAVEAYVEDGGEIADLYTGTEFEVSK